MLIKFDISLMCTTVDPSYSVSFFFIYIFTLLTAPGIKLRGRPDGTMGGREWVERKRKKAGVCREKERRKHREGGRGKNPKRCWRGVGVVPAREGILFNLGG